jgi:glycosyltransferase involved in cell wall biosynthesis
MAATELMLDRKLAGRLGAAGRRYVRAQHSWDDVASSYERLYEQVTSAPRVISLPSGCRVDSPADVV